jgi:hypothetical protein
VHVRAEAKATVGKVTGNTHTDQIISKNVN